MQVLCEVRLRQDISQMVKVVNPTPLSRPPPPRSSPNKKREDKEHPLQKKGKIKSTREPQIRGGGTYQHVQLFSENYRHCLLLFQCFLFSRSLHVEFLVKPVASFFCQIGWPLQPCNFRGISFLFSISILMFCVLNI